MKHASVCSGIGAAELAAEWAGWENIFHCEKNDFSRKVLDYYWPKSISYEDLTTTDFRLWRGKVDVFTAGFPCQPFSTAGKRKGTEDDRHLWPHVIRAIREIQPRYVVGENVRGFTNWNGGLVFDEVLSDLENAGYEVAPFLLPACGVNAPHRRDRIWIVAYSNNKRRSTGFGEIQKENGEIPKWDKNPKSGDASSKTVANTERQRLEGGVRPQRTVRSKQGGKENVADSHQFNGDISGLRAGEISQQQASGVLENNVTNSDSEHRCERRLHPKRPKEAERYIGTCDSREAGNYWQDFPTVSPIRCKYDGVSQIMVRNIKSEVYATIRKDYTDKDLQEVWEAFQSEEIQWKIGRLYKIHEPTILLQTVQLCQTPDNAQGQFSPFGEKASQRLMRKLRSLGSFGCSPRGRELEKQFSLEFNDSMPHLSHEIALAAMEIQEESERFATWLRNESIKAYGNAMVPQVMYEIFKVINQMELQYHFKTLKPI